MGVGTFGIPAAALVHKHDSELATAARHTSYQRSLGKSP